MMPSSREESRRLLRRVKAGDSTLLLGGVQGPLIYLPTRCCVHGCGPTLHGFGLPGSYSWCVIIKLIAIKNLLISSIPELALIANFCLSGHLSCNLIFVKSSKEEIRIWVSQSGKGPHAECCSLSWTCPREVGYHPCLCRLTTPVQQ